MNFLAHQYLSGDNKDIRLGNFIADHVKGKAYLKFSENIQKGIILHRKIDSFTDSHPIVKNNAKLYSQNYGRYSSVVIDVIYDHFLAKNWSNFHQRTLSKFVDESHSIFIKNFLILPPRIKMFLPFLIKSRRLETYSSLDGIKQTLDIMAKHTSLPNESDFAISQTKKNYNILEKDVDLFISEIIQYVQNEANISVEVPFG